MMARTRRILAGAALVCVLVWIALSVGLYAAMRQPPERFGAIMSHVPTVGMIVLPFKPLWMSARAGHLQVGDRAPDFTLRPIRGDVPVTLSEQYKSRPVVLIFGSYT